ncbi:MAG: radical SAM/SPASM domain-containing protein [Bdellovibrionales bacterium]
MRKVISIIESILLRAINADRFLPIQLDITNACNLRCAHCYHSHHKNEGALSLEEWEKILLQYKALIERMRYRPWVIFCGGEPLASPHLFPLLNFVQSQFPDSNVSVLTNGTLINETLVVRFESFRNLRFQVSLDGPDADRHDQIRGEGNFERAIRGVRTLRSRGFDVNVLAVLSKRTFPWIEDFFQLAKTEGFRSLNFTRFIPEGYGRLLVDKEADAPLNSLQLRNAYEKILRFVVSHSVQSRIQGPLFDLLVPGLGRSGRFWESIVIDYQGYIVASSRSKLRLGHAISEGIEKVFFYSPIYQSLRHGKVEVCGKCSHYHVCGGDRNAAYAASGNFLGPDPGCWKEDVG